MGRLSSIIWVALCNHKHSFKGKEAGGLETEGNVATEAQESRGWSEAATSQGTCAASSRWKGEGMDLPYIIENERSADNPF